MATNYRTEWYTTMDQNIFKNKLFEYHLIAMRIFGFIVPNDVKHKHLYFLRGVLFCSLFIVTSALLLTQTLREISAISRATTLLFLSATINILNAFHHQKKIIELLTYVHYDMEKILNSSSAEEVSIVDRMCKYFHKLSAILLVSSLIGVMYEIGEFFYVIVLTPQIFHNEEEMTCVTISTLMLKIFPFHEISNNFLIAYALPIAASIIGGTSIPCFHTAMSMLMACATMRVQSINFKLEHMEEYSEDPKFIAEEHLETGTREDRQCQLIYHCVKEQVELKEFLSDFEKVLRFPLFMDFILSSILICFVLTQLATSYGTHDFFFLLTYLFVSSFIHWVYYWHANELILCSEATLYAAYSSSWYESSRKTRKALFLLMIGSSRPLEIKSYLVPMNISSFIQMIRASYSYFNFIRNAP